MEDIIGIVLAGGLGTRMGKRIGTNKHLTQIYDRPMIDYPLETLVSAGLKNIVVVTGPEYAENFSKALEYWEQERQVSLCYALQKEPRGIAHALSLTEFIVAGRKSIVILGDNYFEEKIPKNKIDEFKKRNSAYIALKELPDSLLYEEKDGIRRARFGIAKVELHSIVSIEEKPIKPKSNYVVTGLYFYPSDVFDKIRRIKPSWRNELEITDVNRLYLEEKRLSCIILDGFWSDMGNPESSYRTTIFLREKGLSY